MTISFCILVCFSRPTSKDDNAVQLLSPNLTRLRYDGKSDAGADSRPSGKEARESASGI